MRLLHIPPLYTAILDRRLHTVAGSLAPDNTCRIRSYSVNCHPGTGVRSMPQGLAARIVVSINAFHGAKHVHLVHRIDNARRSSWHLQFMQKPW